MVFLVFAVCSQNYVQYALNKDQNVCNTYWNIKVLYTNKIDHNLLHQLIRMFIRSKYIWNQVFLYTSICYSHILEFNLHLRPNNCKIVTFIMYINSVFSTSISNKIAKANKYGNTDTRFTRSLTFSL